MGRRVVSGRLEQLEVVQVVDLSPISMAEGADDLRFRIEILRRSGRRASYLARVWRLEFYRIQPSFPSKRRGAIRADEQILVRDTFFAEGVAERTAQDAMSKVVRRIEARFRR